MHWMFNFVFYFPVWGVPLALVFFQFGLHFLRSGGTKKAILSFVLGLAFLGAVGMWFANRGDLNSATWVRQAVGS